MNRRSIFVWSLYDFANSFVFITFLLYFSKWLVVNKGLSDWWYNATYILGSVGLIFFAPWFGSKADTLGKGRNYLAFSTFGCFIFYLLAIASAVYGAPIFLSAFFFGLGNFFYQLSFVFYNPVLGNISTVENRGKVSGFGFFANYLGQISGILISLPFVSGKIAIPGVDSLISPLIPASIIFILLSLPLLLKKDVFAQNNKPSGEKMTQMELFKALRAIPGAMYFIVASFLFSDAITTITNNFSIFTSSVFKVSDSQISILILLVIVCAGIGAWAWGFVADAIGVKKTLTAVLISWVVIIPVIALTESYTFYFTFAVLSGLAIGGSYSTSRQMLIALVPFEMINYSFGIYAISERASTIFGPLMWSIVLSIYDYRMAMLSMVIFQIVSVILIYRVPEKPIMKVVRG